VVVDTDSQENNTETDCDDGEDNDGDGFKDCNDLDCRVTNLRDKLKKGLVNDEECIQTDFLPDVIAVREGGCVNLFNLLNDPTIKNLASGINMLSITNCNFMNSSQSQIDKICPKTDCTIIVSITDASGVIIALEEFEVQMRGIPCPGNPVLFPELASPGSSGLNGGRFGCTRTGSKPKCIPNIVGKRKHNGLDIKANIGDELFSMHSGRVIDKRDGLVACTPGDPALGNFIIIKSNISNKDVFIQYTHMDKVYLSLSQNINAGDLIGTAGNTGNACSTNTNHTHIVVYENFISISNPDNRIDPELFLETKFNNIGKVNENYDPCN